MTNLSPAAQAVLDAFLTQWDVYAVDDARHAMAAALRAAALYCTRERRILMTIAAELEGSK